MTLHLPPLCMLSINCILGLCVPLWNIPDSYWKVSHIPCNRWDKNRKRKRQCIDSGRFTQLWPNTLKTTRKDLITSGNFSLFLFYYLHTVYFKPAGKRRSFRNLSVDQYSHSRCSNFFKKPKTAFETILCFPAFFTEKEKRLIEAYRKGKREYVSTEFNCRQISVIVH